MNTKNLINANRQEYARMVAALDIVTCPATIERIKDRINSLNSVYNVYISNIRF